jgi:polysaccharide biosynthesis/export protein
MKMSSSRKVRGVLAIAVAMFFVTLQEPVLAETQTALPPQSSVSPSDYVLGAGDQIEITVYEYEEYTGPKVILPDGTIALPVVGSITAAGRTPDQLAQELKTQLQAYLVDPVVTVGLNTLRPIVVNVAGEVQRPGAFQIRSLTTITATRPTAGSATTRNQLERVPTVSSALVEAGGITPNADIRKVIVRRSMPGGETSTFTINLWDSLWSEATPQDLLLQDGDAIFVPRIAAGEQVNRRLLARSGLAPSTVRVRVVGEVKEPGEIQVPPDSSISSAVAIAGGPTVDAKLDKVAFVRVNEQGQVERQTLDLRNLTDDQQIQEGDVVIVPKKGSSTVLDTLGRVVSPVGILLRIFGF